MQRVLVQKATPHPDLDVAVVEFAEPMAMWNWNNDGFLTSPPRVTTNGYGRAAYAGSNVSLDGRSVLCLGYGGATEVDPEPPLTYAVMELKVAPEDPGPADDVLGTPKNDAGQVQGPGDSGGPCLTGISTIGDPIAYVHSSTLGGRIGLGTGAESWAGWLFLQLIAP